MFYFATRTSSTMWAEQFSFFLALLQRTYLRASVYRIQAKLLCDSTRTGFTGCKQTRLKKAPRKELPQERIFFKHVQPYCGRIWGPNRLTTKLSLPHCWLLSRAHISFQCDPPVSSYNMWPYGYHCYLLQLSVHPSLPLSMMWLFHVDDPTLDWWWQDRQLDTLHSWSILRFWKVKIF